MLNTFELLALFNLQDNLNLSVLTFENEADWLELRKKGIGGSDIGAIMGLNQHSSPLKVYKQKVENFKEDMSDNAFVKKGKDLEPVILENYVRPYLKTLGYEVGKPDFMIINSDYPYFRANVDGIAYKLGGTYKDNIIIEIKWVSPWAEVNWNKPEYNGIPPSYYAQVQLYMLVTGARKAIVCALFDKNWEMNYFEIPRDEAFILTMIAKGEDFYQHQMLMKMPPKLDYDIDKEEVTEAVKNVVEPTTPSEKLSKYIDKYLANAIKIKAAEETQSDLKNIIFDMYTKGFYPDDPAHKLKSSTVKSNRFNQAKFKEDHPDLYEQYCEDSESPRFTIK